MHRFIVNSLLLVLLAGYSVFAQPGSPDKSFVAWTHTQEAERLEKANDVEALRKAYNEYMKAAELYREVGDKQKYAERLVSAGMVSQSIGELGRAAKLYMEALPIFREIPDRLWEAKTLNLLGVVYSALGEKENSLKLFSISLRIYRDQDEFDEAIPVINNIGRFYEDKGDYAKALEYYNVAIPYTEQLNMEGTRAMILNNIAGVYTKQREFQKALDIYEKILTIFRKTNNREAEIVAFSNIGPVYFEMGDNAKAIEYLNRTLPMASIVGDIRTETRVLRSLMNVYHGMGNRPAAIFFGKQAVNRYQQLRRSTEGLDPETRTLYLNTVEGAYRLLADMLIESGKFAEAEQVLRMLKEEEYVQFVQRDPEEMKSLGQRVSLTPAEQALLDRYLAIYQRITLIGLDYNAVDDRKKNKEPLSRDEEQQHSKLSAQLEDANQAMKLFMEKQLLPELGKTALAGIEYDRSLQDKLRRFPSGTVTLYTVVTPRRYRVVLTTPAVQVDGKTDIPVEELNKKIFAFRALLRNPAADPRPAGKELYDILIKPIEKQLEGAGAKMLAWSLDGALRYIPIGALSPDGKTYLAEKYQTAVLTPKTRDGISDTTKPWQVLGLGVSKSLSVTDPNDAAMMLTFRALPGAKKELERIIRDQARPGETGILTGKRFLDAEFTSRTLPDFLAAGSTSKFSVIHVASHFRLGSDWKNSFLLLGDGNILTLQQLNSTLPVSFGDIDLVTLSACNTAATGDATGKEIDSLAEAIQAKGGKAILATLWAISDEGTSQLMAEFYRGRKDTPGITKAEALQAAQRAMISGKLSLPPDLAIRLKPKTAPSSGPVYPFDVNKPFAHPYYWSPFVLIGNWR